MVPIQMGLIILEEAIQGGLRTAAKQVQPTGRCPQINLVPQCATTLSNNRCIFVLHYNIQFADDILVY